MLSPSDNLQYLLEDVRNLRQSIQSAASSPPLLSSPVFANSLLPISYPKKQRSPARVSPSSQQFPSLSPHFGARSSPSSQSQMISSSSVGSTPSFWTAREAPSRSYVLSPYANSPTGSTSIPQRYDQISSSPGSPMFVGPSYGGRSEQKSAVPPPNPLFYSSDAGAPSSSPTVVATSTQSRYLLSPGGSAIEAYTSESPISSRTAAVSIDAAAISSLETERLRKLYNVYRDAVEPQMESLKKTSVEFKSYYEQLAEDARVLSDTLRAAVRSIPLDGKSEKVSHHLSPPAYERRPDSEFIAMQAAKEDAQALSLELERLRLLVRSLTRDLKTEKKTSQYKDQAVSAMQSEMMALKELFEKEGKQVRGLHSIISMAAKSQNSFGENSTEREQNLFKQLISLQENVESLKAEKEQMERSENEKNLTIAQKNILISEIEKKIEKIPEYVREIEILSQNISEKDKKIAIFESEITELNLRLQSSQLKIQKSNNDNSEIESLKMEIAKNRKDLANLESDLRVSRDLNISLQSQISTLQRENSGENGGKGGQIEFKNAQLENEIRTLKAKIQQLEQERESSLEIFFGGDKEGAKIQALARQRNSEASAQLPPLKIADTSVSAGKLKKKDRGGIFGGKKKTKTFCVRRGDIFSVYNLNEIRFEDEGAFEVLSPPIIELDTKRFLVIYDQKTPLEFSFAPRNEEISESNQITFVAKSVGECSFWVEILSADSAEKRAELMQLLKKNRGVWPPKNE